MIELNRVEQAEPGSEQSSLEPSLNWAQGGLNPCPTGYEPVALPD
jgi:hypothetical protein